MLSLFYSCAPEEQRGQATSPMSQSEGTETPPTPSRIYSGQPKQRPPAPSAELIVLGVIMMHC